MLLLHVAGTEGVIILPSDEPVARRRLAEGEDSSGTGENEEEGFVEVLTKAQVLDQKRKQVQEEEERRRQEVGVCVGGGGDPLRASGCCRQ